MPRFIARVRIDTHCSAHRPLPEGADLNQLAAEMSLPEVDPIDWIIDPFTPIVATPDDAKPDTVRYETHFAARRPMAVYASNEAEAEKIALASAHHWRGDVFSVLQTGWYSTFGQPYVESIRKDKTAKRPRTSFEVDFAHLLAPDRSLYPLHLDQAFEAFRWMVASSETYEQRCPSHVQKVHHLLNGDQPRTGENSVAMIRSTRDLKQRFLYAILGQSYEIYKTWREDHGITPNAKLTFNVAHHGPNARDIESGHKGLQESFKFLCESARGLKLAKSPNQYHSDAVLIQGFGVCVSPTSFAFVINYGIDLERCASSWQITLAQSRGGEPFYETLDRAICRFHSLVPDAEQQVSDRYRRPAATPILAAA